MVFMVVIDFFIPVLYVFFVWWFSTGAILYLDGLDRRTYPLTFCVASGVLVLALVGISKTAGDLSVWAAYVSFTCGLLVWGWNEMAFLMGYLTGPRRSACPETVTGWRRFWLATQTILFHEVAIALTFTALLVLTWGQPNKVGLWAFVILWGMRLSAKLNLFLGVRNLSENFLPPHLEYLKTYFLRRPINFLFPVSLTVATMVFTAVVLAGLSPDLSRPKTVELTVLATLLALGALEHWFLVLPFSSETLWKWGLVSHRQPQGEREGVTSGEEGKGKMTQDHEKLQMSGRIGPNSIIQVHKALGVLASAADTVAVFEKADLAGYLKALPEKMIPETEVIALHKALRDTLSPEVVDQVMRRAGETTADYLLANRIPKAVSAILKRLPAGAAAWVLLNAISRNAWTFTGTGRFSWASGRPWRLTIEDSPLCREENGADGPVCAYYTATFQKLFRVLVSPAAKVREVACGATGHPCCVFEVSW